MKIYHLQRPYIRIPTVRKGKPVTCKLSAFLDYPDSELTTEIALAYQHGADLTDTQELVVPVTVSGKVKPIEFSIALNEQLAEGGFPYEWFIENLTTYK